MSEPAGVEFPLDNGLGRALRLKPSPFRSRSDIQLDAYARRSGADRRQQLDALLDRAQRAYDHDPLFHARVHYGRQLALGAMEKLSEDVDVDECLKTLDLAVLCGAFAASLDIVNGALL